MTTQDNKKTPPIAIVGGGLAGTMFLVHTLARIAEDPTITAPVHLKLVERYPEQMQGGVAYSRGPAYRGHNLNSGARTMNFFPVGKYPAGFPTFVEYIQQQAQEQGDPAILHALTDPPRQMVSEYMSHMLDLAIAKAGPKAKVDLEMAQVTGLDKKRGGGATLHCADGSSFEASHVVLSTGFQETTAPRFARSVADHPRFVGQPYTHEANEAFQTVCKDKNCENVLIMGTGLTAMDVASRLIHQGYEGKITMISRRGFMHTTFEPTTPEEYLARRIKGEPRPQAELEFTKKPPKFLRSHSTRTLVKNVIKEFAELTARGYSSGEILGYWERFVPDVAAKFPKADLAALYGAYEALITSRRAGVTPDTGVTVRDGIASGQIKVHTGVIKDVGEEDGKLMVKYHPVTSGSSLFKVAFTTASPRGEGLEIREPYDFVFSAMGNSTLFDMDNPDCDPLWRDMLNKGYAVQHWTKAGIDVSQDFLLRDALGNTSSSISAIGVPISGHMVVTRYPYPDSPGVSGGKLGPTSLNAGAIMSETLLLLQSRYDDLVAPFKPQQADAVPLRPKRAGGMTP